MTGHGSPAPEGRWRRAAPRIVLALALVVASWPAWRVALLGRAPTVAELMALRCATRN